MTTLELFGQTHKFPSTWEELTPNHLERIGAFLLEPWTPKLQYLLIRLILPIHPKVWTVLTDDEILALLPITNFLKTPVVPKGFRLFKIGMRGYFLPSRLKIRAADWVGSEPLIQMYLKTSEEKYLDHLVVTVCRPVKWWIWLLPFLKNWVTNWDGDIREKYHSEWASIRATKIGHVPLHKKLMVLWWFIQIRWEVSRKYKSLFQSSGGESGDWTECMMDLAERGLFGNLEQTFQTNFDMVLRFLNKEKKRIKANSK